MHDVPRALALLGEGDEVGLAARTCSLSPGQVGAALRDACRLENQLVALRYSLIRASLVQDDGKAPGEGDPVWGYRPLAGEAAGHLPAGRRPRRGEVDNATLVEPETGTLAELGQALADGEVSREHVDVARRTLAQLPPQVVRSHRAQVAQNLTDNARRFTPGGAKKIARHLLPVLVRARADRLDPHAHERRQGWCAWDAAGMLRGNGLLAGQAAAAFKTVFDHLTAARQGRDPDGPRSRCPAPPTRTPAQRGTDAM